MEDLFYALWSECRGLAEYQGFNVKRFEGSFKIGYWLHWKDYTIIQVQLYHTGKIYLESWQYSEGKFVKDQREFDAPVTYISETVSGMIIRRLSDLGIYTLEKK